MRPFLPPRGRAGEPLQRLVHPRVRSCGSRSVTRAMALLVLFFSAACNLVFGLDPLTYEPAQRILALADAADGAIADADPVEDASSDVRFSSDTADAAHDGDDGSADARDDASDAEDDGG